MTVLLVLMQTLLFGGVVVTVIDFHILMNNNIMDNLVKVLSSLFLIFNQGISLSAKAVYSFESRYMYQDLISNTVYSDSK